MKFVLIAIGSIALSYVASAQVIPDRATLNALLVSSTTDDFETFNIADGTATGLDVFSLDSTTIANGQGPGLVNPGATYIDSNSDRLQWNGHTYFELNTKTIIVPGDFLITYQSVPQAMGIDAKPFEGFPFSGAMEIYDGATLLHTINFNMAGTAGEIKFLGYQNAAGITHVVLKDLTDPFSPIIDDHTYGLVPEPASLTVLGLGALALLRRRKRKAA